MHIIALQVLRYNCPSSKENNEQHSSHMYWGALQTFRKNWDERQFCQVAVSRQFMFMFLCFHLSLYCSDTTRGWYQVNFRHLHCFIMKQKSAHILCYNHEELIIVMQHTKQGEYQFKKMSKKNTLWNVLICAPPRWVLEKIKSPKQWLHACLKRNPGIARVTPEGERSTPEAYQNAGDPLINGGQSSLYRTMRISLMEGTNINTGNNGDVSSNQMSSNLLSANHGMYIVRAQHSVILSNILIYCKVLHLHG